MSTTPAPTSDSAIVQYLYRDGANWKDYYSFTCPIDQLPSVGDEVTMGEHGTPNNATFFEIFHPYSYDPEFDHDLLFVESIEQAI